MCLVSLVAPEPEFIRCAIPLTPAAFDFRLYLLAWGQCYFTVLPTGGLPNGEFLWLPLTCGSWL